MSRKFWRSFLFLFFVLAYSGLNAQVIRGTIKDKTKLGLPGVSVLVKGTTIGTTTDLDGKFELDVKGGKTLELTMIGYANQTVAIQNAATEINVLMEDDTQKLDEVVVTALGMSREKKSLGYAVTEIKGDDITKSNLVSPITGLQGKTPGVQINMGTGGPQAANRILIRGNTSLGNNNQPLFVIDGVFIDNDVTASAEWGAQQDFGNDIKNLNTDDFESVSVLKGAAATALYGSRAANGVILITTKRGKKGEGLGVSFTQSLSFDKAYAYPDYQNEFGPGVQPIWGLNSDGSLNRSTSEVVNFGPRFDGLPYLQSGKEFLYTARPNNVKQMFQTGVYSNTNVALQGGDEKSAFRFSYSRLNSNGISLNNHFKRNSFSLNASRQISKIINADGGFTWSISDIKNPTFQGGNGSPIYDFAYSGSAPRNYDTEYWLSHYRNARGDGWNEAEDPYSYSKIIWDYLENNYLRNERNFRGFMNVNFTITDWLSLKLKGDMNQIYATQEDKVLATGSSKYEGAKYKVDESSKQQYKLTAMLSATKQVGDFGINGSIAIEQWDTRSSFVRGETQSGLLNPGVFDISNSVKPAKIDARNNYNRKRINSAYAFANFDYKNQVFLDVTGRNDWSSSLIYSDGSGNVSYFYPSVSTSWLLRETLKDKLPKVISFAKVRASYAIVGNDCEPYLTSIGFYRLNSDTNGTGENRVPGGPGGSFSYYEFDSDALRNTNLKPEKQHSIEFGTEVKFFNNRLGFDFAWYKTNTKNQILSLAQASETGVRRRWINAGNIQNQGIEFVLSGSPIRTKNIQWDLSANITMNRNKIVALAPDVPLYAIEGAGMDLTAYATEGGSYGDIYTAYVYKRNDKGEKIVNSDGTWTRLGEQTKVGSIQPKFLGGLSSSFRYKAFSLNVIMDGRFGGDIASGTYNYGMFSGALQGSLYGRDESYGGLKRILADGRIINDGMIPEGVFDQGIIIKGTDVSGMSYADAYTRGLVDPVSAERYYYNKYSWGAGLREEAIHKLTWVALREISFHWNIPQKWTNKFAIKSANLGLLVRNVGYLYNSLPDNIHPEGLPSNRSSDFVERGGTPFVRNYGFNINLTF